MPTDVREQGGRGRERRAGPLGPAKVTVELNRGFFVARTLLPTPFSLEETAPQKTGDGISPTFPTNVAGVMSGTPGAGRQP